MAFRISRLLKAAALFSSISLSSLVLAQAPATVTGTVFDSGGNPATGGTVEFDIQPMSGSLQYFVQGVGVIAPQSVVCGINSSGLVKNLTNLSLPCTVWGNDIISPSNTTYTVIFSPNGQATNQVPQECISGSSYNLNTPVFCPNVQVIPQYNTITTPQINTNLIPQVNHVFTLGNTTSHFAAAYIDNLFTSGGPFTLPVSIGNGGTGATTQAGAFTAIVGPGGAITGTLQVQNSLFFADGSAWCSPLSPVFGAKFDGTTDDTTADQAFLNYAASHSCAGQLPAGTTLISSSPTVPFTQNLHLSGMCRICTTFKMATDNTPVFIFNSPNTHSLDFSYFGVTWTNQQGTANTNAAAFLFTTSSTDASGFYRNHFHDLNIDKAHRIFAVTSAAGQETFWGNTIEEVAATNLTGSFYTATPFTSIGMPINRLNGNTIFGYSPASVNTENEPTFNEVAGELEINGNIIQNWNQEVLSGQGGGHVSFRDNHIENQSLASSSGRVFFFANGSWVIENNSIAMIPGQTGLANAQVFGTNSTQVTWDSNRLDAPVAASIGTWYLTNNTGSTIKGGNNLDTFTSLTPMLAASVAEWIPGSQFNPSYSQNQSVVQQFVQTSTNPATSGYCTFLAADSATPSIVCYRNTGASANWHVERYFTDGSKVYHVQSCSDVTGTIAGPPSSTPSGCSDDWTVDSNGNTKVFGTENAVTGYQVGGAAPSGHFLRGDGTKYGDGTIQSGDLPVTVPLVGAPAVGQATCIKSLVSGVYTIGVCSTTVGAGGACTCI